MTKENPQDRILNQLRKQKISCTVHLTNGYQLKNAIVRAFDSFVIVILCDGKQMMLYKHAVFIDYDVTADCFGSDFRSGRRIIMEVL